VCKGTAVKNIAKAWGKDKMSLKALFDPVLTSMLTELHKFAAGLCKKFI
jgi:hypothetical protein